MPRTQRFPGRWPARSLLALLAATSGVVDRAAAQATSTPAVAGSSPATQPAHETRRQYLSGTGPHDAVPWEFFCTTGRKSGAWTTIPVPGCWDVLGFGRLAFYIDDEKNEVERGRYRRSFDVPADWAGRRVQVVFEGVMTDTEVKINGRSAGPIHQGGFYQFKYDLTDLLRIGGENVIEVEVAKKSSNVSINRAERTADYWLFGGIYRPVYLEALPAEHVERVAIDARADGTFAIDVHASRVASVDRASVELFDASGTSVAVAEAAPEADGMTTLRASVPTPALWTAETPSLYTARVRLSSGGRVVHEVSRRFGFRTVEVRKGDGIYVNGTRVVMKGICRHAIWPDSGRTLSPAMDRDDVLLIKSMNMNAVRSTHYPPDQAFLDQCDELGLYVIDELGGWQKSYDAETAVRLAASVVARDANHPSIILWANGNEGGWNVAADPVFKERDPQQRAVIHPWALHDELNTKHYPKYDALRKLLAGPDVVLPTEFLHGLYDGGMGAGLRDYWDAIRASKVGAGGFLWVLGDEGVLRDGRIDVAGNAAPDGIVGPYREREASAHTVQKIWSPVVLPDALPAGFAGTLEVRNDYDFTPLGRVKFTWELRKWHGPDDTQAGHAVLASGTAASPDVAPQQSGTLRLDLPSGVNGADALAVTATDPTGRVIWTWVYALASKPAATATMGAATAGAATLTSGGVTLTLDPATGSIQSVTKAGRAIPLTNGPRLTLGTPRAKPAPRNPATTRSATRSATRAATSAPATPVPTGRLTSATWTAEAEGWFRLDYAYEASGPVEFVGITFDLPEASVKSMRYLGVGPHPVYRNRLEGGTPGVWEKSYNDTITGWAAWTFPEFKGYHADVRWARLTTDAGTITVRPESGGSYLRVLSPKLPPGDLVRTAFAPFPEGGLSLLDAIPAIGTKFDAADELGPQSQPFVANGTYRGTVRLRFE